VSLASVPRGWRKRFGGIKGEAGDYLICQTVAPPKSQLANPACQKISITFGNPVYPANEFFSLP